MSAVVGGKSYYSKKNWNELNSGVMVIEPNESIRDKLIDNMNSMSIKNKTLKKSHQKEKFFSKIKILELKNKVYKKFNGIGDQDVLEEFFDWKNKPELHLDKSFNVFFNYTDYYKEKLGITPKCYHFVGAKKPWSLTPKEITKIEKSKSKTNPLEYAAFDEYKNIIYDNADKNQPKFSIIIPMKNAEQYIKKALDSIKLQNYPKVEIIIVDDASTDNSKHCVENFCKENLELGSKIKMYNTAEEHRGPGAGRNIGLDNATGDYILFLDADDILNEGALKNISRTISLNPEADIFSLGYQLTRLGFNEENIGTMKFNPEKSKSQDFSKLVPILQGKYGMFVLDEVYMNSLRS